MSMITIEAADGSGDKRKVSEESFRRWPQAKDAAGKVIPGHRMWGRRAAFNTADDVAPKPMRPQAPKVPVVPLEVSGRTAPAVVEPAEVEPQGQVLPEVPQAIARERQKPGPKPRAK